MYLFLRSCLEKKTGRQEKLDNMPKDNLSIKRKLQNNLYERFFIYRVEINSRSKSSAKLFNCLCALMQSLRNKRQFFLRPNS